jgi:hypothetical protein
MTIWKILMLSLIPCAKAGGEYVIDYLDREINDLLNQSKTAERGGYCSR